MASACFEPYTWLPSPEKPSPDLSPDFEFFRLEDPSVTPADELFSDGKLVPLKRISTARSPSTSQDPKPPTPKPFRVSDLPDPDPYAFSPRAPTCSIRWKNILRLKKTTKTTSSSSSSSPITATATSSARSLTSVLSRAGSKPPASKDSDTDSVSTSSRLSLSSSSSSHDHDDVAPKQGNRRACSVLADSPRLNSSGKVVFERSSSSPGSFTGGPRHKHNGGIERSYSAHVKVAPVLNVPVVCSIRGSSKFGFPLFGTHKREIGNGNIRIQRRNSRNGNRTDQA